MAQYREILRLTAMGLSQRSILDSVGCSQKTVVKVQRRARELKLSWPLGDIMTDAVLEETLFPKARCQTSIISAENSSGTASTRNCCGRSIWRLAAKAAESL